MQTIRGRSCSSDSRDPLFAEAGRHRPVHVPQADAREIVAGLQVAAGDDTSSRMADSYPLFVAVRWS